MPPNPIRFRIRKAAGHPSIAVVICTRDRPEALRKTLTSIWSQTRRPDELILIDDGRLPEKLRGEIAGRCGALGIRWRYQRTAAPGLTRARNLAADLATSEVLQYIDDDVTCDSEFIAEIVNLMRDPSIGGVTATVAEPAFSTLGARLYQVGYRLAGWWRVAPRRRPTTRRPAILARPDVAVRARWLSGAAMALRRDAVREHRFDEDLAGYALGEDREMGYRLSGRLWLVESKRARVVHRRDPAERTDSRRFGLMTSFNYLRILRKTCRLGPGDWLLIGWGLGVVAAMHAVGCVLGDRRAHLEELLGMLDGVRLALGPARPAGDSRSRRESSVRTRPLAFCTAVGQAARARRVLFVTNRLEPGGAETMLVSLAARLTQHNVQPHILCLKDAGPLAPACRQAGALVFEGLLRHKTDATVILRIRRIILEHDIDIVVAAHSGGDRMFWSTLAARLLETPVVVWSHWFPRAGENHIERANRALYRWVDAFVAVGERQRLALIRHEYVPAGRVSVICNAIDYQRYACAEARAPTRRRLRLSDQHVAVAIVANFRCEKRHDVFIEAARRLAAVNERVRFFVIGDGPDRDAVQAAAAACGLDPETLRLLGARDDVPELLSAMDVVCLCSEVECFSVTMLEAAAAGCAFIGPDVGSIPEFLQDRTTGLLIRPADVASLADAMAELAEDAALRARLAAAAREKVRQEHGTELMVQGFAELFFSLERGTRFRARVQHTETPKRQNAETPIRRNVVRTWVR